MTDLTIPNEIARQIGGGAFAMMGTRLKAMSINGISFDVHGSRLCSHIRITLAPDDTYTLEFVKASKGRILEHIDGIYADQLHEIIGEKTGLALSL